MNNKKNKRKSDMFNESLPAYKKLIDLAYGISRWQTLEVGIELKIFDHLSQSISAEEVARPLSYHPVNTGLLLNGLTALGLVTKEQEKYKNTHLSAAYLVSDSPTYLGNFLRYQISSIAVPKKTMIKMVQTGPTELPTVDQDSRDVAFHYSNYLRAGMSKLYVDVLDNIEALDQPKKILDLGGGPGITCIAFAEKYPEAIVVLFEQNAEVEVARQIIELNKFEGRVTTMAGDFLNDSIGDGYDLIFAGYTLNYARFELDRVLKKVKAALNPGGIFVCAGDGLTHGRTAPSDFVIAMMTWAMAGQDMAFDEGEVAEAMCRVNLNVLGSFVTKSPLGPMNIDISQKPFE